MFLGKKKSRTQHFCINAIWYSVPKLMSEPNKAANGKIWEGRLSIYGRALAKLALLSNSCACKKESGVQDCVKLCGLMGKKTNSEFI